MDLRELPVLLSLATNSWLQSDRRPVLLLLLVCVNALKMGDASTCMHQTYVMTRIVPPSQKKWCVLTYQWESGVSSSSSSNDLHVTTKSSAKSRAQAQAETPAATH